MSQNLEILVTPMYLKQRAQNIRELLQKAMDGYAQIEESSRKTEYCFEGECADKVRKRIGLRIEKGTKQLNSLFSLAQKLSQIAEEYEAAEKENKGVADRNRS